MKKFALALMAASAAVFGFGLVASAQSYESSLSVGSVAGGGAYSATYENCVVGETITFTQPDSQPTSVDGMCMATGAVGSLLGLLSAPPANGTAVGNFTAAPTAGGTYIVTGVGTISPERTTEFLIEQAATTTEAATTTTEAGAVAPTTVPATTPPGGLPATGSDGVSTSAAIALGLLVAGIGLFVVAQVRRRPTTA